MAGHGSITGEGATHHIIHQGRHEIGGMCIEVAAGDGTRILRDLGMPLRAPGYWERNAGIRSWAPRAGVEPHFVHSCGHAWPDDLERLVAAIGAKQTIWVHTDAPNPSVDA